ncbi:hypothetical protein TNCV_1561621 [Trichonephila clavipes]|nr:hypothetical protein TNCV_1561621 [Trichonephila clavipes]
MHRSELHTPSRCSCRLHKGVQVTVRRSAPILELIQTLEVPPSIYSHQKSHLGITIGLWLHSIDNRCTGQLRRITKTMQSYLFASSVDLPGNVD